MTDQREAVEIEQSDLDYRFEFESLNDKLASIDESVQFRLELMWEALREQRGNHQRLERIEHLLGIAANIICVLWASAVYAGFYALGAGTSFYERHGIATAFALLNLGLAQFGFWRARNSI